MSQAPTSLIAGLLLATAALVSCGGGDDSAEATTAPNPGDEIGKAADAEPPAEDAPDDAPDALPYAASAQAATPTACDSATGPRLYVGPGKTYSRPSQAAAAAGNGAVVVISAGDYVGDVATWSQSNLTLCGAGGRARLFANGKNAGGKGIWVIRGSNVTVDSVEFHDARVPDLNGAGIRAEGNGLKIINAGFFDNENGILGPNAGDLTISRSEFARNGVGERGRTHNIYVGAANKVSVTSSFFHEARIGHNFKSRAKETRIENSYFMDGPTGTASYQIDVPNGGVVYLRGNLLQKGPNADNNVSVAYGAEGLAGGVKHTLTMIHNTLASTDSGGTFVSIAAGVASVKLSANVFAGSGAGKYKGVVSSKVSESGSVQCGVTGLTAPDNIGQPNFWPSTSSGGCAVTLSGVPDASYTRDAPRPYVLRSITATSRRSGALQSAP